MGLLIWGGGGGHLFPILANGLGASYWRMSQLGALYSRNHKILQCKMGLFLNSNNIAEVVWI